MRRRSSVALSPTLSQRQRGKRRDAPTAKSFFRVVTTDEARARIAATAPVGTETIRAAKALGRVLAEDLAAAVDLPHFDRANMDGYAVPAADTFGASASIPA